MAREGSGFTGISIGGDSFTDAVATRGSAGTLYVETLVSCATGNFTTTNLTTVNTTTVSASSLTATGALAASAANITGAVSASAVNTTGNITPLGWIVNTADAAGIAQGASAGDANALSNAVTYITVVSAGPGGYILDGNVRTQHIYNTTACAATLYAPTGGTIDVVSSLSIAASGGYVVNQVSGTLAFTIKGA